MGVSLLSEEAVGRPSRDLYISSLLKKRLSTSEISYVEGCDRNLEISEVMVVKQRRNKIGTDGNIETESLVEKKSPKVHPAIVVLGLVTLLTVITVFAFTMPKTKPGKVPEWLDMIKEAEREAKEGKLVKDEKEEMEQFVDLWSKRGVMEENEEEIEERREETLKSENSENT